MTFRVLNLGGGVQSTRLLLGAVRGEFGDPPAAAIFADTGWEPAAVYRHLDWLEVEVGARIPIHRVTAGDLRADTLAGAASEAGRTTMPFHARKEDGADILMRRKCTVEYKLAPLRRKTRELMEAAGEKSAEVWIGISLDEAHRMKDADVKYLTHRYPLVDGRITRNDCIQWFLRHGYPVPPKSSCLGCPYHSRDQWREIKTGDPAGWADAVAFDAAIRRIPGWEGEAFLARDLVPLPMLNLSTPEERGQPNLFGNECLGLCGV